MAELAAILGVPHNPLLWRTMRSDPVPEDLVQTRANFTRFADAIDAADVDVLVVVGSDHLRQFQWGNSPAFCIGKTERFACTFENEIRTFGLEPWEMIGDPELASWLLGDAELQPEIDFAMSNEWVLDHSFTLPAKFLTPDLDIPIVPIHTNANIPPIPRAERYAALGRYLRSRIEAAPFDRKVALIASGHLATEIGGPRQFLGGGSPDPEFDDLATEWMRTGDLDGAIAGCTFERLATAGNVTGQFLNFITALAAARGPASFAEGTPSRFANGPFFLWDL
ncbi:MAG: extradiol ring-cleavage dioxygenase [Acidimicrobiia bacterium]|nr:extradiol ring-cleavage dioxygenase [Acidimicrobiia bacterium]